MAGKIEDYGLIGDCTTAALVGRDGSIDWLCWPHFDSDACFAALLGSEKHGRWQIAPSEKILNIARRYRGDTLILETTYTTETGEVVLIDFMPGHQQSSDVVRLVRGIRGSVKMRRPPCPRARTQRATSSWKRASWRRSSAEAPACRYRPSYQRPL